MTNAIEASGLTKRYGKTWALHDCSFSLPAGRVAALVGPNGAGKTTLLHLVVGLAAPTSGSVRTLGAPPRERADVVGRWDSSPRTYPCTGPSASARCSSLGRRLNPTWDDQLADDRIRRVRALRPERTGGRSRGPRQVALTIAVAETTRAARARRAPGQPRPAPARREFLGSLMEAAADADVTVLLSSHLVADLERVCDYLIVLSDSRVQVLGDVDRLLAEHRVLSGPRIDRDDVPGVASVVSARHTQRQSTMFVRTDGPIHDPAWSVDEVSLEDLVLAYLAHPAASALPGPSRPPAQPRSEVRA